MRLSAADCLRRGWANLSANWELVPIQWLDGVLMAALTAFGAFLVLLTAGAGLSGPLRLARLPPALLAALPAALAVGGAALLLHCWFQAGTFGVLAAADRQALPGPRRSPAFFRAFSPRDFRGWGGLYVWRFVGAALLFGLLAIAVGGIAVLWLLSAAAGGARWGSPAALGIGAGGALPVGFLALTSALWLPLALAGLAREGASLRAACRQGLDVLGRRLGTVAVLVLLALGAALGIALAFLAAAAAADSLLAGASGPRALVRFLLLLLQAFPNTLLAMLLAGALVALVRSETASGSRRHSEVQTA